MINCSHCQSVCSLGARYCNSCGNAMPPVYIPPQPQKKCGCGIAAIIGGTMVALFLAGIVVFGVFLFRVLEDAHIRNIPWEPNPMFECMPGQHELPHWAQAGPPRGHWNRNARMYENPRLGIAIDFSWEWEAFCDDCIARFRRFDGTWHLSGDVFVELAASRDESLINLIVYYERIDSSLTAETYVMALNELRMADGDEPMVVHEELAQIGAYGWLSYRVETYDDYLLLVQTHWFVRVQGGFAQIIQVLYHDGDDALEEILAMFSEIEPDELHGELRPLCFRGEII